MNMKSTTKLFTHFLMSQATKYTYVTCSDSCKIILETSFNGRLTHIVLEAMAPQPEDELLW